MKHDNVVEQSGWGVRLRFVFGPTILTYAIRDASGERTFDVPYENLAIPKIGSLTVNNVIFVRRLRLVPLIGVLTGFVLSNIVPKVAGLITLASLIMFITLVACGYLKLFAVKYTIVPLSPSPPAAQGHLVRVINDKLGPQIIDELKGRWRSRLKSLYGQANLAGDPQTEIARLKWLLEIEVLTEAEFNFETARLTAFAAMSSGQATPDIIN